MEALLALVVMTSIDDEPWRWLLGLSAIPLLLVTLVFPVSCCIELTVNGNICKCVVAIVLTYSFARFYNYDYK